MIPKIIGRCVDAYFRQAFSRDAPPPMLETFCEAHGRQLQTFVYPSLSEDRNAPVAAFYFGGGWHHGSPWQLAAIAKDLSRRGVTVYLPEYRVAAWDKVSVADALSDSRIFFKWMVERHTDNPIFLGGSSAGGFLAANTGVTENRKPSGLVLFNPALNLKRERVARIWPVLEQPGTFSLDDLLALDPIRNLSENIPPTIILHGARDPIVPLSWIEDYAKEVRSRGGDCRVKAFEGYSHGFVNKALFPKAHARAIQAAIEFITDIANAV